MPGGGGLRAAPCLRCANRPWPPRALPRLPGGTLQAFARSSGGWLITPQYQMTHRAPRWAPCDPCRHARGLLSSFQLAVRKSCCQGDQVLEDNFGTEILG